TYELLRNSVCAVAKIDGHRGFYGQWISPRAGDGTAVRIGRAELALAEPAAAPGRATGLGRCWRWTMRRGQRVALLRERQSDSACRGQDAFQASPTVSSTMLTRSITGESSRKPRLSGQRNAMAGLRNPDQLRPAMAYIRALAATPVRRRQNVGRWSVKASVARSACCCQLSRD